jgi:hypothetical protein
MTAPFIADSLLALRVVALNQFANPVLAIARYFRHFGAALPAAQQPQHLSLTAFHAAFRPPIVCFQFVSRQIARYLDTSRHSLIIYPVLVSETDWKGQN